MPCYDPDTHLEPERLRQKIHMLTDLLCKAGRAYANETPIPKEVVEFWLEHRKLDKERGEPW